MHNFIVRNAKAKKITLRANRINVSWFIGRRLMSAENPTLSRFVIRVAMVAVALSLAVMIIANSVVTGFQQAISNKIFGFWGHIIIQSIDQTQSYENDPVSIIQPFYKSLDSLKEIRHIQVFATKPGILKTDSDIDGIVLKGIGPDFDWNFLKAIHCRWKAIRCCRFKHYE